MYYTVYRTRNDINNKQYTGQHKTLDLDDGYLGSGKIILQAIKKYGKENFSKTILFVCDTFEEMDSIEKLIVNKDYTLREDTYNINEGGHNGAKSESSIQKLKDTWKNKTAEEKESINNLRREWHINLSDDDRLDKSKRTSEALKENHKTWSDDKKELKRQRQSDAHKNRSPEDEAKRQRKRNETSRINRENGIFRTTNNVTCPHCGLIGATNNMNRYHFDNCKSLKVNNGYK